MVKSATRGLVVAGRVLLATGLALVLAVAGSAAAHADSGSWGDPRDRGLALDITKVRLVNDDHQVNVQISLRDFDWARAERGGVTVWFDTDRSRPGPEYLAGGSISREREWSFQRTRGWGGNGRIVSYCRSKLTPDPNTDSIRWTLGRNCMESRGAVRVSVRVQRYNRAYTRTVADHSPARKRFDGFVNRG